jgi:purine catabolism regulator
MNKEIGIKLSKIISNGYIGKSKVLTAKKSLNNIVTKTNVMVDPDILKWTNEGEFILSTSYFFKNSDLEFQKEMINEMSRLKVAALGIKIKPYLSELPVEILDLAEKLGFPIIDIDYDISFNSIMIPILQEIYDKQSQIIRKVEIIHQDNMNVVLKGGGVKDILKSLSKTMINPIYVVDHHFEEIIKQSDIDLDKEKKLLEIIDVFFNGRKNNKMISKTSEKSVFIDGKEITQLMVPIMVKNNVYGHLITFGINHTLQKFDVLNLESSSNIMALEFLKRLSVQDVENRYKAEFFEDLISLDEKRIEKAVERSNHYGFLKDGYYSVIKIKVNNHFDDIDKNFLAQIINKSIYLIDLVCKDKKKPFLISNKSNSINVLVMFENNNNIDKKVLSLVKGINQILRAKISNLDCCFGVGRNYMGLENVYKSLSDALKATDAFGNYSTDEIIFFDELGIYKIFCHDVLKDELIDFYNITLSKLVEYDEKRDANLVKTLEMYFEQNGNLKRMSEQLFTHYNTILYRMKRIQDICGVDINKRKERYNLETALEIHKIINK